MSFKAPSATQSYYLCSLGLLYYCFMSTYDVKTLSMMMVMTRNQAMEQKRYSGTNICLVL
jgi:hypothetical protein